MNYLLVIDFGYISLVSQANDFILLCYNVTLFLELINYFIYLLSLGLLLSLDLIFFWV